MKTYSGMIHPIPFEESWNEFESEQQLLSSVNYKPKKRRPPNQKIKEIIKPVKHIRQHELKYSICNPFRHNLKY